MISGLKNLFGNRAERVIRFQRLRGSPVVVGGLLCTRRWGLCGAKMNYQPLGAKASPTKEHVPAIQAPLLTLLEHPVSLCLW